MEWSVCHCRGLWVQQQSGKSESKQNKEELQYFGHLMWRVDSLEKTLLLGGIGGRRRRGLQKMMAGWHHRLDGRESEWTLGVGDGQGSLVCCHSWGRKESDMTEWLNWTELREEGWGGALYCTLRPKRLRRLGLGKGVGLERHRMQLWPNGCCGSVPCAIGWSRGTDTVHGHDSSCLAE